MIGGRATTALLIAVTAIVFVILYGPIVVPIASSFFSGDDEMAVTSYPRAFAN